MRQTLRINDVIFGGLYVFTLYLLLCFICYPTQFVVAPLDNDTSYHYLLVHALSEKLQFGVDFHSTYGPLGWLTSRVFYPRMDLYILRLLFLAVIALFVVVQAYAVRRNNSRAFSWSYLFGIFLAALSADPILYFPDGLYLSLLFWQLVLLEGLEKSDKFFRPFVVVSAIFFPILSLVKGTLLFASILTSFLFFIVLLLKNRFLSLLFAFAWISTFVALWSILLSQSIGNLFQFVYSSLDFAKAYAAGMIRFGIQDGIMRSAFACSVIVFYTLFIFKDCYQRRTWDLHRIIFSICGLALAFIAWKHAAMRATATTTLFALGTISCFSGILSLENKSRLLLPITVFLQACILIFCWPLIASEQKFEFFIQQQGARISEGISRPLKLEEQFRDLSKKYSNMAASIELPIIEELSSQGFSFDFYGDLEGIGIAKKGNLKIARAPESAHVASPRLLQLNEASLIENSPDYILANYKHRPEHLPAQADSRWFLRFLLDYTYLFDQGQFSVFRKTFSKKKLLECGRFKSIEFNSKQELPSHEKQEIVLLSISTDSVFAEKVVEFFYRPSIIWIHLQFADGEQKKYPINRKISNTSFPLSPFFEGSDDVKAFKNNETVRKIESFSLQSNNEENFSRPKIQICTMIVAN